ncbi:protein SOB FIVE-LIKE 3-like [Hibiscus syriacus]|uniref:protein SOB FIVE-LIKE 3-like n=1 Tax=Hibiscus syriacus TaxID=106335 RepID=UPI001923A51B|nr:protein SOB FIVE-LIKE 3-like [Hibiscus syriacus]
MEPSQTYGAQEESHSSESGWTMYIGSPIHGGSDDSGSEKAAAADADDQSDDSMASDASSGPRRQSHGRKGLFLGQER